MCIENPECTFYKKLQKIIDEYFKSQNCNVFHYTNSLRLIKASCYLKLQSHKRLNDKKNNEELVCGVNLVRKEMGKSDRFIDLIEFFNKYMATGLDVYTCSFCEDKRSRYAFKEYGRSNINFKRAFFSNLEKHALKHGIPYLYGKVIYKGKTQQRIIKRLFDCYDEYSRLCNNANTSFFTSITLILPLLKPYRHHQDKESRMISMQIKDHTEKLVTTEALCKANFNLPDIKQISFSFQKKNCLRGFV